MGVRRGGRIIASPSNHGTWSGNQVLVQFGITVLVQFGITPKAFANSSPGFERSENPGMRE
jgi:hypothetical protein